MTDSNLPQVNLDALILSPDQLADNKLAERLAGERKKQYCQIVQDNTTDRDLKKKAGEGAIVLSPSGEVLAKAEETIQVVPLWFFKSWGITSDYNDNNSPFFMEKTRNPSSEIAQRSRQIRQGRHEEEYEGKDGKRYTKKFQSIYNLFFYVYENGNPLKGETFQWSMMSTATRSAAALTEALLKPMELYGSPTMLHPWAQVWEAGTQLTAPDSQGRQWYIPRFERPENDGEKHINPDEFAKFEAMHKEFEANDENLSEAVEGDTEKEKPRSAEFEEL